VPAVALVEGQAQPDGVEPGADVAAVESVPGAVGTEVCLLGELLGRGVVVQDQVRRRTRPG
jgi:hypothetical protein